MGTPVPSRSKEIVKIDNEITVYKMPPEEIAKRYGPPVPRRQSKTGDRLIQAIKTSSSVNEVAEKLGSSVGTVNRVMGVRGLQGYFKNKPKEVEQSMDVTAMKVNQLNGEQTAAAEPNTNEDQPKKRSDIIREKLTKDLYTSMKSQGLSDRQVLGELSLPYWVDLLTELKREWGLIGEAFTYNQSAEKNPKETLTLWEALNRRTLLETQRDKINSELDRLNHVLNSVTVEV